MRKVEKLFVGRTDANIQIIVGESLLSQFDSVLITSIDSIVDIATTVVGKRLVAADSRCIFLDAGVIVPGEIIARLGASLNLFNGFDELWCFKRPPVMAKPNSLSIASPYNVETEDLPASLSSWMAETECQLALGDGIGLNFITPQEDLAHRLEQWDAQFLS